MHIYALRVKVNTTIDNIFIKNKKNHKLLINKDKSIG